MTGRELELRTVTVRPLVSLDDPAIRRLIVKAEEQRAELEATVAPEVLAELDAAIHRADELYVFGAGSPSDVGR